MAKAKIKKNFRDRMMTVISTKRENIRVGFSHIDIWLSLGNYAMNRMMSGRFDRGLLFGRNYVFYGESGSGKSLMAAISAADAQKNQNALVVWIDVEHATDDTVGQEWLKRAGLDLDNNFIYLSMIELVDVKKIISDMAMEYRDLQKNGETDLQPIVFVVDSWAACKTKSGWGHAEKGELVGDMGQKAKQTGETILDLTHLCSGIPLMCIGIQHIMDNQDGYGRRHKTTGGNKMIYYASGCLLLTKSELNEENVDNKSVIQAYKRRKENLTADMKKVKAIVGITARVENLKSRVSKPFERIDIQIPFNTGLDPYSGLFDLLLQEGAIQMGETAGWYSYALPTGEAKKFQKGTFVDHAPTIMVSATHDISAANPEKLEAPDEETPEEE